MSILFSDSGMAKGSNLSCYGSQGFPRYRFWFSGGNMSICRLKEMVNTIMNIQERDFEIYRGDDTTFILEVRDSKGEKIDFSGAELKMRLESKTHKVDFSLGNGLAIENGDVNIIFAHNLTKDWNFKQAKYDLQMTDTKGKVKTILRGNIEIVYDITP